MTVAGPSRSPLRCRGNGMDSTSFEHVQWIRGRFRHRAISVALVAALPWVGAGCAKPLFPSDADRTQFDQYDRQRGQYVEPMETDFYGRETPALRARLRPR